MRDTTEAASNDLFVVSEEEAGERLDKLLALHYSDQSRQYFQSLIDQGEILLNGKVPKKRDKPKAGDSIEVHFKLTEELDLTPENIPLDIIYEDDQLIVVNKPVGMVVHPAPGNWTGTFVNALLFHCKALESSGEPLRPGIVHRLDKDTSGLLVAAKTVKAHQKLVELFSERKVEKRYLAVCWGKPAAEQIDLPIGRHQVHRKKMCTREDGKAASTRIELLGSHEGLSVVAAYPKTGRTHQIRVHLKALNAPIVGDELYGSSTVNKKFGIQRQLLHAQRLQFPHPITGEPVSFSAPPPQTMLKIIHQVLPDFT